MPTLPPTWYNRSSFQHVSNPNRNHRPARGRDPPFQSPLIVRQHHRAHSSSTSAHLSSCSHQGQASRVNAAQEPSGGRSTELSQLARYPQRDDMGQTTPNTSAYWQAKPRRSPLLVYPPPDQLVSYPAPHDQHARDAFTPSSSNPDEFLRGLLVCFLHSKWVHNQDCEPQMMDDYSQCVLHQVANLNGCLPIDFNNPKKSLLTVFVERSGSRPSCLICSKSRGSIPRAVGCVRSHLRFKPFHCEGCRSCNEKDGYATFWTEALLRDHVGGQKMVNCTECGKMFRRRNLRRHQAAMHERTPRDHFRFLKHTSTPVSDTEEETEDMIIDDGSG